MGESYHPRSFNTWLDITGMKFPGYLLYKLKIILIQLLELLADNFHTTNLYLPLNSF